MCGGVRESYADLAQKQESSQGMLRWQQETRAYAPDIKGVVEGLLDHMQG